MPAFYGVGVGSSLLKLMITDKASPKKFPFVSVMRQVLVTMPPLSVGALSKMDSSIRPPGWTVWVNVNGWPFISSPPK